MTAADRRREPTIRRLFEEYFEQDRTPAERAIRAYHAMPHPRTVEEAITAARLLGLKGKAIQRIRKAYQRTTRPNEAMLRANANLGRAYCDASR